MTNTKTTKTTQKANHREIPKAVGLRSTAARAARVALVTALVAVGLVVPPLAAGLVAPPAHAATTTTTTAPPIVVNSKFDFGDLDPNDGVCDISAGTDEPCTLRAAIQEANATPGADVIRFKIPAAFRDPATGVVTISPQTPLPTISGRVTIDGYTQPGASPNTLAKGANAQLKIELDGTNLPSDNGLELEGSSGSVIRGLVIERFGTGIRLDGGTAVNRIEGNFIGTDPSGTLDRGNSNGVILFGASQNAIGGTTPAARNLISGNASGIFVTGDANKVLGNFIGTDSSGTGALSNDQIGVALVKGSANGSDSGNRIGNGTSAGSNTVAFNGQAGIAAGGPGVVRNPISHNSIFSNGGPGIDLVADINGFGVTPNDRGDSDTGPNELQNFPVLSSAKSSATATAITGKLNSARDDTYTIEFFSNPSFTDEGKTFIGRKTVTTDRSGNATFVFKPASRVPVGLAITATATDASGNTSEFSAPRQVARS